MLILFLYLAVILMITIPKLAHQEISKLPSSIKTFIDIDREFLNLKSTVIDMEVTYSNILLFFDITVYNDGRKIIIREFSGIVVFCVGITPNYNIIKTPVKSSSGVVENKHRRDLAMPPKSCDIFLLLPPLQKKKN